MTGNEEHGEAPAFLTGGHGLPFAGIVTFNRSDHTQDLEGADLAVLGAPFDLGAVNRPGARFGPHAIRQQSIYAAALQPVYPWREDLGA